jgi:hypothetical protein
MRQWMINPIFLCTQHLLGEHVECHMTVGTLLRKKSIKGYIEKGVLQPSSINDRHNTLVKEMLRRGIQHKSPLKNVDISYLPQEHIDFKVDIHKSFHDLIERCPLCKQRIYKIIKHKNNY